MEEHPQARYIIDTLTQAGFIAYYAGGWVRDFLLGHPSDDIDIATSAPPETVQALFPKTVPLGISFGIVLVLVDGHQYEVATFRNDLEYQDGRRPTKIEFTNAIEDAKRRDFTINGMFYDPIQGKVLDYIGGKEDLEKKVIRAIGNPHERIREDRLRMIRGIRLACRFHFQIDPSTADAIRAHANELFPAVAIERIVQELEKGQGVGKLRTMLIRLHEFDLLPAIFPALNSLPLAEIEQMLEPTRHFPPQAPLIAHLLELFPASSLNERLELCKSLKLPNLDHQLTAFLFHANEFIHQNHELIEWAYFYANRFSALSLQIIASRLDEKKRTDFLHHHESHIATLADSIERIRNRDPFIKSDDLLTIGVSPGKTMGLLLKEAEKIAINEQIQDKNIILERLKKLM